MCFDERPSPILAVNFDVMQFWFVGGINRNLPVCSYLISWFCATLSTLHRLALYVFESCVLDGKLNSPSPILRATCLPWVSCKIRGGIHFSSLKKKQTISCQIFESWKRRVGQTPFLDKHDKTISPLLARKHILRSTQVFCISVCGLDFVSHWNLKYHFRHDRVISFVL